jgi:hypothetical protein
MKGMVYPALQDWITFPYNGRDQSLSNQACCQGIRPPAQSQAHLLFQSLGLLPNFPSPTLWFLLASNKTILDRAARLRKAPNRMFTTKTEAIIHLLAGTVLGTRVQQQGSLDWQVMYRTWQNLQARSYAEDSQWLNEQNYDATFNPFPEGVDNVEPHQTKSYWIKIPDVDIVITHHIHVAVFLFSCKHVSTPGSGGRISERIFTSHATMTDFHRFYDRNRMHCGSINTWLTVFHDQYLQQ